jgi:type II secretory pathway pseudopilin PulG
MKRAPIASDGFSLLEALFAAGLATVAVAAVVQLFASAAAANRTARDATEATLLAADKLEDLRARSLDDPALAPPGVDSLAADVDGYWDAPRLDYVRRWSIAPVPSHPSESVAIHVLVFRQSTTAARDGVHLVTIRTRKAT